MNKISKKTSNKTETNDKETSKIINEITEM
jgi:hypothetical protein